MAEEEKEIDLLATMDAFASSLLTEAQGVKKLSGEPTSPDITVALADKIKVFSAVREWMNARKEFVRPGDSGKAKGERLRDQFRQRTAPPNRRTRAASETPAESDGDAGADSAESSVN